MQALNSKFLDSLKSEINWALGEGIIFQILDSLETKIQIKADKGMLFCQIAFLRQIYN